MAGSGLLTEEEYLYIENLTALLLYNAHPSLNVNKNMKLWTIINLKYTPKLCVNINKLKKKKERKKERKIKKEKKKERKK